MFQIWETQPVYCGITDAQIGTESKPKLYCYRSEALARKLAARMTTEHYEACGDGWFEAIPVGFTPSTWRWQCNRLAERSTWSDGEELPF
jgi:hypothetical protein